MVHIMICFHHEKMLVVKLLSFRTENYIKYVY